MKLAIIGRTELLYETALYLKKAGHEITCILTAKEAPEYRKKSEDFRLLADRWNIPFAEGSKILGFSEFLEKSNSDIAVSINYSGVIPQSITNLFPLGILNAHGGDLPKYKGNACQAWAIINGEEKIGLCIHRMIGGELDNGDILARKIYPIDLKTKIADVYAWFERDIPLLYLEAISELAKNPNYILEIQSKDPKDSLRCYPRIPEDGKIDWKKDNIEILRLINASGDPYSGAFCEFDGRKLTIWDAEIFQDDEIYLAVPGQISEHTSHDGSIVVICGKGKLKIKEISFDGQRGKPSEFIRTIRKRLT